MTWRARCTVHSAGASSPIPRFEFFRISIVVLPKAAEHVPPLQGLAGRPGVVMSAFARIYHAPAEDMLADGSVTALITPRMVQSTCCRRSDSQGSDGGKVDQNLARQYAGVAPSMSFMASDSHAGPMTPGELSDGSVPYAHSARPWNSGGGRRCALCSRS
jgi:hypothetical protein